MALATGSDDFCRGAREDFGGGLELAEVKQTLGPSAVVTLSLDAARTRIREAAARALAREAPAPLQVGPPIEVEVELHQDHMQARALELGGDPSTAPRSRGGRGVDGRESGLWAWGRPGSAGPEARRG